VRRRAAEACLSRRSCFLIAVVAHGVDTRSALLPSPKAHARHTNKETHLKPPGMRSLIGRTFPPADFSPFEPSTNNLETFETPASPFLDSLVIKHLETRRPRVPSQNCFHYKGALETFKERSRSLEGCLLVTNSLLNKTNRQFILITFYPSLIPSICFRDIIMLINLNEENHQLHIEYVSWI
jgi:hypothetical protein